MVGKKYKKEAEEKQNIATTLNKSDVERLREIAGKYNRKMSDYIRTLILIDLEKEGRK